MRCPDCNKFVPFDSESEPEVEIHVDSQGGISGTVRITNNCEECGQELKEATFEIDLDVRDDFDRHLEEAKLDKGDDDEDHNLEVELGATRTDYMQDKTRTGKPIKNPRYMKHMYGAEGDVVVTCSCGEWSTTVPWSDAVAGSGMDELV